LSSGKPKNKSYILKIYLHKNKCPVIIRSTSLIIRVIRELENILQWNLCNLTPEFSDILWHPTKNYGPKVFLLTKIKPEYSDILHNLTH
jgi:hypothetical protein